MKYIKNTLDFHVGEPTVISLGKFDGIHRGHELLMEKLAQKKEEGLKAAIFTFDIPPKKNVEHIEAKVLTTNEEKMHIFEGIGIDYLIECPFTREVMCMEPEDFIRMLVEKLNVKCIVAGEDFHFGHNRRGDYQMLKKYAPVYGYEALILSKMKEDERDISSTFVREEIMAGNIEKANHLLGYRYFVTGMVKHGNQIGRTIGIPTIKLGGIPGWGSTVLLPRTVGASRAKELLYTGRSLSAEEALKLGVVEDVVEPDEVLKRAFELADTITDMAPLAVENMKKSINTAMSTRLEESLGTETDIFASCFGTQDHLEATTAFLEKRAHGEFMRK